MIGLNFWGFLPSGHKTVSRVKKQNKITSDTVIQKLLLLTTQEWLRHLKQEVNKFHFCHYSYSNLLVEILFTVHSSTVNCQNYRQNLLMVLKAVKCPLLIVIITKSQNITKINAGITMYTISYRIIIILFLRCQRSK